jgi:hypothetical protein
METDLRLRAERAAADSLRTIRTHTRFLDMPAGYLEDWADNLIDGVTPADFEADLRRGAGSELTDRPGEPAKFRAAFSSSALAVNTFGPFRHQPGRLTLAGVAGFDSVEFEYPCDNGLVGTNPNFDLFARTSSTVIAVESKFLEPLRPKPAAFSAQYARPFLGDSQHPPIAEAPWTRMYRTLCSDPQAYRYLDAAQLVKHYLGLIHSFPTLERTLAHIYWEPNNATELVGYRDMRREVSDFATAVAGCKTRFIVIAYPDLWREWEQNRARLDLTQHIARLRRRYDFSI